MNKQLEIPLSLRNDNLTQGAPPEDFEEYMNWLIALSETNPEAYGKEFEKEVSTND